MPYIIKQIYLLFIVLIMSEILKIFKASDSMYSSGCNGCMCFWKSSMQTADCSNRHFSTIPSKLMSGILCLDLSDNNLSVIQRAAFASVNLKNLQKIYLKKCRINTIDNDAFQNLTGLTELDLSDNEIRVLNGQMFRDSKKLRRLYCMNNQIQVLEKHLFKDFIHLQVVKFSRNRIHTIDSEAFYNVGVRTVNIDGNNLKYLDVRLIRSMHNLTSIDLTDNPWSCDCRLRDLRNYILEKRLCTLLIKCDQPLRLRQRSWANIDPDEFACRPQIVDSQVENIYHVIDSSNFTLHCKVDGDPEPTIDWYIKDQILDKKSSHHFNQEFGFINPFYWNNLTIVDLKLHDRGEYKCIAKNFAGFDERNFLLQIPENYGSSTLVFGTNDGFEKWSIIFAITIIIVTIFIILILLIFCLFRKHCSLKYDKKPANDRLVPNGDLSINSTYVSDDVDKSLIDSINPTVKTPRQQFMNSTPIDNNIRNNLEHGEVLNKLLDNDSFSTNTDDKRELIYNENLSPRLHIEQRNLTNHKNSRPYPPDLLSFPGQISPTGSSTSTILMTSLQQKPSPNHLSQQSSTMLVSNSSNTNNLYRTLPHPRSQSPFIGLPVCVPKTAGYVTIPRRPRASWSCAPTQNLMPINSEPVYDNLGLRTTVTGSSVLSLNKTLDRSSSSKSKVIIASSTPKSITAQTLTSSPSPSSSSSSNLLNITPKSISSIEMNGICKKSTKIPPRPPPKPKKLINTGPLFEDEGEDGTEV